MGVSLINMDIALERINRWIAARERQYVSVCNVHTVMDCRRNERLRQIVNGAGMTTPDGMPLVWLSRLAGHRYVSRVYGPDLLVAAMADSGARGHRHFFFGGREGVADRLATEMQRRFPGVQVAGSFTPPVASAQALCTTEIAERINQVSPDIVWVGVSSPKQELWMACMRPLLEAPVLIGIGAAFDFHTGTVRQAPRWMQRSGLEWVFRLAVEPRRLWRRYLIDNPWFLFELTRQKVGLKQYPLH